MNFNFIQRYIKHISSEMRLVNLWTTFFSFSFLFLWLWTTFYINKLVDAYMKHDSGEMLTFSLKNTEVKNEGGCCVYPIHGFFMSCLTNLRDLSRAVSWLKTACGKHLFLYYSIFFNWIIWYENYWIKNFKNYTYKKLYLFKIIKYLIHIYMNNLINFYFIL